MYYDFDRVIDRRNTYAIKHNPVAGGKPEDVLPMWVADMDFQSPPGVLARLAQQVQHGIFGYSEPDAGYFPGIQHWYRQRFGWQVEEDWLVMAPGVVTAIYIAIRALTNTGDGVVIQQPVYPPFESAIKETGRKCLVNALIYENEKYRIDFNDFERKIKQAKLFILCSPHNPVGRVWTQEELMHMGEICLKYGVKVISDEIHQDFVYPGHTHTVFAGLDARLAKVTATCTAPSKTFNLAGLQNANIFIANPALRNAFERAYAVSGLSQPGIMGLVSCQAAYEEGGPWLDALLSYLNGNRELLHSFLQTHTPQIKLIPTEGTYLAWLDFRALNLSDQELDQTVTQKAKLWLKNGVSFGVGGTGFQRMNFACPRAVLSEALARLARVFG